MSRAALLGVSTVIATLTIVGLYPIIVHPGVPAFQQDWLWPVHQVQCSGFMSFGFSPWNSSGIGSPQVYPQPWWPYALAGPLCYVAGPHWALCALLAIYLSLAGFSIALLATRWTCDPIAIAGGVAVYLGNPVLLNMLHAGHLHFLASYSIFPLLLAALLAERTKQNWLLLGVLAGLASAQQQFFVFAFIAVIAGAICNGKRWLAQQAHLVLLIAILFTMPQWCVGAIDGHSASLFVYRPLIAWERAQSAGIGEALRTFGYIGLYDRLDLPTFLRRALWAYPASAVIGLYLNRRHATAPLWVLLIVSGLAIVTGLDGPLQLPWAWAFMHFSITGFLRELYNATALIILAYAAAISLAIASLPTALGHVRIIACGVLLAISIGVCSHYADGFSYFSPTPEAVKSIVALANAPGTSRYLTAPAVLPMRTTLASRGGTSPFIIAIGSHPSALSDLSIFPNTFLSLERAGPPNTLWLQRAGISQILSIPGLMSVADVEPALRSVLPQKPGATIKNYALYSAASSKRISIERFSGLADSFNVDYRGTAILRPAEVGASAQLFDAGDAPDPRISWVRTPFWKSLPAWAYLQPPGIFTLSWTRPVKSLPADYLVGSTDGNPSSAQCVRSERIDKHFVLLRCGRDPTLRGRPPLVLSRVIVAPVRANVPAVSANSGAKPEIHIQSERPWKIEAFIDVPAGYALVLHDQYNPAWQCNSCGYHFVADGFANAWIPAHELRGYYTLLYWPAIIYFGALALSWTLLIVAIFSVARVGVLQPTKILRG